MKAKRILIKISGESFQKENQKFHIPTITDYAWQINELSKQGYQVAIVVGGGNLWRGQVAKSLNFDRSAADYIGMVGTMMNGLILEQTIEKKFELDVRVMSPIEVDKIMEPYIEKKAKRHLEKGRILIFVSGVGSPYFTTDTAAALRSCEIGVNQIMLSKNGVDGVYDKDPAVHKDAKKYDLLTYAEMFDKNIRVMDKTAAAMLSENNIEMIVFNANEKNSIIKAINGQIPFTKITN